MNRRLAMTLLSAALLARPARARAERRIMVIGAGVSGLAAARDLRAAGHQVLVVDARARIGGRIHTSRLWPDLPMDLGASWIHGAKGNPVTVLADHAGAKRVATSYDRSIALGPDGKKIELVDSITTAEALVETARANAGNRDSDVSLAKAIQSSPAWAKAEAQTRRQVRHYVNGAYEQEYSGDWTEASAWHVDSGSEFPGQDVLFPGGYDQIVVHLADRFAVRMGQRVTALAPVPEGVTVTLANGPTLTFDHAVVTLPLGVLRSGSVSFAEPLAPARQKAIDSLGMGVLNKCWLCFDRIAWDDSVDWIEWLGPRDGHWSQWVSLARTTRDPVLLAFHAGSQARELEALDDDATRTAAHDALKSMFGTRFPAPLAAQVTRWSQDPYALGSYSFHATGSTPDDRLSLGGTDWNGRLVFAGEAASADYPGTVHGALLSGQAAARTILENAG
jgi:monoamine oxidase